MYKDDKKYHMDLKENARGRFLKVSETFTRGYSRFQVGKSNHCKENSWIDGHITALAHGYCVMAINSNVYPTIL